jgi:hypothetical protein
VTLGEALNTTGTTGTMSCWGENASGQLGDGTTTSATLPVTVAGMVGATRISTGRNQTCAVSTQFTGETDGLACWGRRIDNGHAVDTAVPTLAGASYVRNLHAGSLSSCVTGQLELANPPSIQTGTGCWGSNSEGQIGNPSVALNSSSVAPVRVQGI